MATKHQPLGTEPCITFDEFLREFKPYKNRITSDRAYDGYMYETYGEERDLVYRQRGNHVLTLLDDGKTIIAGRHFANRLGYFIVRHIPEGFVEATLTD